MMKQSTVKELSGGKGEREEARGKVPVAVVVAVEGLEGSCRGDAGEGERAELAGTVGEVPKKRQECNDIIPYAWCAQCTIVRMVSVRIVNVRMRLRLEFELWLGLGLGRGLEEVRKRVRVRKRGRVGFSRVGVRVRVGIRVQ